MNGLIGWAGTVCMAAAGCTALHMLVGKTGTGRVFRLLTSAFFLCAVFSPLLSLRGDLQLPDISAGAPEINPLEMQSMEQIERITADILLQTVNTTFENYELKADRVEIRMDTSDDGSISISNITVFLQDADSLERVWAKQIAEQRLGTEVEIAIAE